VYTAAREGRTPWKNARGQTLDPLASSEARSHWLNGAAGVFGTAGAGANALKLANAVRIGTGVVGISADALAMGNQMRDVALHWDQMSAQDRVTAGLQFAFLGTTTGVQLRCGGRGMFDFQAGRQRR
jgi:hypothetical protein